MIGNIYWLKTEGEILHPHVVVRVDDDSVIVCSITTNTKKLNMPGNVVLEISEGNLEKQSIVEVMKEYIVRKSELGDVVGTLSEDRVKEILNGIGFLKRSFLDKR